MSSVLCAIALSAAQASAPALTAPVEVPFRIGDDAIIVDAKVNGRPVACMYDTGFSGSFVLDSAINVGPATGTMTLRDFVGQFEANTVKIKSLSLGPLNIPPGDRTIVSRGGSDYSFAYGQHVDGIMGLEVMKDYVFTIDFQRQKFIFHPSSYDITKKKPDNVKTHLVRMLPMGANSIELMADPGTGETMKLALDTGNAFYATTHRDVLERVKLWAPGKKPKFQKESGVASGSVESWTIRMKPMKIFGVAVQETLWDIIDLPSSSAEHDGTVGFGFLKNFNITVDLGRRRVWMEQWAPKVENEALGDVGLSAGYFTEAKRTYIFSVSPESPANKAGIKEGDSLLAVDGVDTDHVGYRKLRAMLEGPVGSKVNLAYSRNGILRRVDLIRQPLYND